MNLHCSECQCRLKPRRDHWYQNRVTGKIICLTCAPIVGIKPTLSTEPPKDFQPEWPNGFKIPM